MDKEIVISIKTILFTLILGISVYLFIVMKPVILTVLIAMIIVIAMEHPIGIIMTQKFMNKPVSRGVAVIISYFTLAMLVILALVIVLPPVVTQAQKLMISLSDFVKSIPGFEQANIGVKDLFGDLSKVSENFFTTTFSFFSGITTVLSLLIISIYMSVDWPNIKKKIFSFFRGNLKQQVQDTFDEIELSIGHWVKGQLYLMVIVGFMSFGGLVLFRVEYALALGLISGLLEIVPVLGPLIAVVIGSIVGFSDSFTKGVLVVGLFTLIQQIENNFLVPKVMQRVSGFSPLAILIALLIGTRLLGTIGAIISVPTMMVGVVILKQVLKYQPNKSE